MASSKLFAAIDIGSSKVCCAIARRHSHSAVEVVSLGVSASRGVQKGTIVDAAEAAVSVGEAVGEAKSHLEYHVEDALVVVNSTYLSSVYGQGEVGLESGGGRVSDRHVAQAVSASENIQVPEHARVVHTIPCTFLIDGAECFEPFGERGQKLAVESHVVIAHSQEIKKLVDIVRQAGLNVEGLVAQPVATGDAVLTEGEKQAGVLLIDIGAGTTSIAAFVNGSLWYLSSLPVGGSQVTGDIALEFEIPFPVAEALKLGYGNCTPDSVDPAQQVNMPYRELADRKPVQRQKLCEIITARMEEILHLAYTQVRQANPEMTAPSGVVLIGGTANLPGLKALAHRVLGVPSRVGRPAHLKGQPDVMDNPAYAASVGALIHSTADGYEIGRSRGGNRNNRKDYSFKLALPRLR